MPSKIFGILNVTPDSFSDGMAYNAGQFVAYAKTMLTDGAYAIDIGAESTRPGAIAITPDEEWKRLETVLNSLSPSSCGLTVGNIRRDPVVKPQDDVILSIDTRHPETAEKALIYNNVKYINDVSGFDNPKMIKVVATHDGNIIAMHSLTVPADKNITLTTPPVETIQKWIDTKFTQLTKAGIDPARITFDPGLGFGKTPEQSMEIIQHAQTLADFCHARKTKILYGHSRKSFMGGDIATRDQKTAELSLYLQKAGVDYIRVHNIAINQKLLQQETGN